MKQLTLPMSDMPMTLDTMQAIGREALTPGIRDYGFANVDWRQLHGQLALVVTIGHTARYHKFPAGTTVDGLVDGTQRFLNALRRAVAKVVLVGEIPE